MMGGTLRNILMTIRYNGTAYHGFQVQRNALSICQVFQDAVEDVLGKRWDVKGCSRTDTGVHATDYKLSMIIDSSIACPRLILALNRKLPPDIAVVLAQDMPMDFHARYHAMSKQYTYKIYNSSIKNPFMTNLAYNYPWQIDEKLLDNEAQVFVGTHDFSAFCTAAKLVENPVRTIKSISVTREEDMVIIVVEGDGFLHNMVRIIVGSLLAVATGRLKPGELGRVLVSKDRQNAGKTAPPHGLYLTKVNYPAELGVIL